MRRELLKSLAIVVVLAGASPVQAGIIAADFTTGTDAFPLVLQTLGWEFTLSTPKVVTSLGVWDEDGNGLVESHQVAIWTTSGVLLTQTTVTNSSIPQPSVSSDGRWLFEDLLVPLTLLPGTYVIGADYPTTLDHIRTDVSGLTMASGVTFNGVRFTSNPTLALDFPDTSGIRLGHFGPNMELSEPLSAAVPEPASLTLLALAITGAGGYYWRRKRVG